MYLLSQIWLHLLVACVAGAGFGAGLRWFCARRSQARALEQAQADADASRQREVQLLQSRHTQELVAVQQRIDQTQTQASQDLAQRDADLAALREQHAALTQEATGHRERAEALSAELAPLRLQANQSAGDLVQLKGRHDALEGQLAAVQAELVQARQAHALAEQEGAAHLQALQSRLDEAGAQVAAGQAEQARTLQDLQSANGRVDVLLQEAAQAALARQALSDQLSAVNEQLAEKGQTARQQQLELERLTAELTDSQAEGARTRDAAAVAAAAALAAQQALRHEVDQNHVHAQERQALLGRERDTLHARLSNAQQQLLARQEALDAAAQRQEALQAELAAESSRCAEVLESHARAEQGWMERLQVLQARTEEAQVALERTQATLERTQAEQERLAQALAATSSRAEGLQQEVEQGAGDRQTLMQNLVKAQDQLAGQVEAGLRQQAELQRLTTELQESRSETAQLADRLAAKEQALQALQERTDRLSAELEQQRSEAGDAAAAAAAAALVTQQALRRELERANSGAQEQLAAWAQERDLFNGRLQEARQAVQQAQAERDELQQQVHTLALRVGETLRSGQEALATALAEQRLAHEAAWAQSEAALVERDQRLAEQAAELSSQLRRQTALGSEMDSLRRQLAQQSEAQLQVKAAAERDFEAATQREQGLIAELAALRLSLESNDEQLALHTARLQQEKARQSGLETALVDCRNARSRLDEEANRLRRQAEELQAENLQLRQAEARAQAELAEAQAARPTVSPLAALSAEALEPLVLAAGAGLPPPGQAQPDGAALDDLKVIVGIGPVNEAWLHQQGIWSFAQIASWNAAEVAWIAHHLPNFGSRVFRENWVAQAARLAAGEPVDVATRR